MNGLSILGVCHKQVLSNIDEKLKDFWVRIQNCTVQRSNIVDGCIGLLHHIHRLQILQFLDRLGFNCQNMELVEAEAIVLKHFFGHVSSQSRISQENDLLEVGDQIAKQIVLVLHV